MCNEPPPVTVLAFFHLETFLFAGPFMLTMSRTLYSSSNTYSVNLYKIHTCYCLNQHGNKIRHKLKGYQERRRVPQSTAETNNDSDHLVSKI